MKILIEIPEEFEEQFLQDKFAYSLERIRVDMEIGEKCFCEPYELNLIEMLKKAFKETLKYV